MKIYGLRLKEEFRFLHIDEYDTSEDEEGCVFINPEEEISSTCHLYEDSKGNQYVGFEASLGLKVSEMEELLGEPGQYIIL